MSAKPAPPGPVECLQRGLRSLRANWQLVPLAWAQTMLTLGLMLAGLFILLAGVGVGVVAWLRELGPGWQRQLAEDLATSLETGLPALSPLLVPLIAASLVWTLAFCLYCYLQGGVVGVLARAEMAAGAGLPDWRAFRVFSGARFDRQGRRLFWRYFWLNHLYAAALLAWMLLFAGLVALSVRLATDSVPGGGIAIGCVGMVPLMLSLLPLAAWLLLATVEVARPGSGVRAASRRALRHLRRRFVPVLVVCLLAAAGIVMLSAVFMPLEWWVGLAADDRTLVWLGGHGVLMAVKSAAGHTLVVTLLATVAALVGLPAAARVESAS